MSIQVFAVAAKSAFSSVVLDCWRSREEQLKSQKFMSDLNKISIAFDFELHNNQPLHVIDVAEFFKLHTNADLSIDEAHLDGFNSFMGISKDLPINKVKSPHVKVTPSTPAMVVKLEELKDLPLVPVEVPKSFVCVWYNFDDSKWIGNLSIADNLDDLYSPIPSDKVKGVTILEIISEAKPTSISHMRRLFEKTTLTMDDYNIDKFEWFINHFDNLVSTTDESELVKSTVDFMTKEEISKAVKTVIDLKGSQIYYKDLGDDWLEFKWYKLKQVSTIPSNSDIEPILNSIISNKLEVIGLNTSSRGISSWTLNVKI